MTLTCWGVRFDQIMCCGTYAAELLHEHDEERGLRCTTVAAHEEELFPQRLAGALSLLDFEKLVRVVHVAGGLDLVVAETTQRVEGFVEFALLHVPSWRLAGSALVLSFRKNDLPPDRSTLEYRQ